MIWTADEMLQATGAQLAGGTFGGARGISIDSRSLQPGDVFFAIRGEARDGHDFVSMALDRGAAAAVIAAHETDRFSGKGPLLIVPDVLDALVALGKASRARTRAAIVAVTGSVGKTSTKETLRHVLAAQGPTHASVASYNNQWGVPLTLARMPRAARFGVFEIGMNHPFEILPLTDMVRPDVAIVTTVEPVHLAQFRGLEGIADAKGEIFAGLEPGGTAVINRDNPYFARLCAHAAAGRAGRIVSFGRHEAADVRLLRLGLKPDQSTIEASVLGQTLAYKLGTPGEHMALNSLSVLAAVHAIGADLALAGIAMASMSPVSGRGQRTLMYTSDGPFTLLDESYNANPASMRASLALLGQMSVGFRGRRIAVLGDMLELGPTAPQMHAALASAVSANRIDLVFASGPLMKSLWDVLPLEVRGAYADDSTALQDAVLSSVLEGDAVMVKGSLGSRMGVIVAAMKSRFSSAGTPAVTS
jgi:UDP-N-acetylmuramoyl-tripeptide--D-alanyl-D-alanine ligase